MLNSGVIVNAWVKFDETCSITYSVGPDEAEFMIGPQGRAFELLATEDGLAKLVDVATAALREIQAGGGDE
jgi:hypothetical protein